MTNTVRPAEDDPWAVFLSMEPEVGVDAALERLHAAVAAQHTQEIAQLTEQIGLMFADIDNEKRRSEAAEAQIRTLSQEIEQWKMDYATAVGSRDAEIRRLAAQLGNHGMAEVVTAPGGEPMTQDKKKQRAMCKDCGERYAQELGRCRQCWRRRIEGKSAPTTWRPERSTK